MVADPMKPGYYWCSHDMAMWIPDGGEFPREWHVVFIDDRYVSHAGADVQTRLDEVPAYVRFNGPLVAPHAGWQPIETAPRDGALIDVWTPDGRVADAAWQAPDREWQGEERLPAWCFQEWHHDEMHWHEVDPVPTHWMPIPGGPT